MERHKDAHFTLSLAMQLIIAGGFGNLYRPRGAGRIIFFFDKPKEKTAGIQRHRIGADI